MIAYNFAATKHGKKEGSDGYKSIRLILLQSIIS
jgi:hypothetical protein